MNYFTFTGILNNIKRTEESFLYDLTPSQIRHSFDLQQSESNTDLIFEVEKIINNLKKNKASTSDQLFLAEILKKKYSLSWNDVLTDLEPKSVVFNEYEELNVGRQLFKTNKNNETKLVYTYYDGAFSPHSLVIPEILDIHYTTKDGLDLIMNKGHYLEQFTYFLTDDVFFSWIDEKENRLRSKLMKESDSCYIPSFVPHAFGLKENAVGPGRILAVLYPPKQRPNDEKHGRVWF